MGNKFAWLPLVMSYQMSPWPVLWQHEPPDLFSHTCTGVSGPWESWELQRPSVLAGAAPIRIFITQKGVSGPWATPAHYLCQGNPGGRGGQGFQPGHIAYTLTSAACPPLNAPCPFVENRIVRREC